MINNFDDKTGLNFLKNKFVHADELVSMLWGLAEGYDDKNIKEFTEKIEGLIYSHADKIEFLNNSNVKNENFNKPEICPKCGCEMELKYENTEHSSLTNSYWFCLNCYIKGLKK